VLDTFLRSIIGLVENLGEGTSDNFWAEILNTISDCLKDGRDFHEEIYAKGNSRFCF